MIRDQRGSSLFGAMVAITFFIVVLVIALSATSDQYLVKNMSLETERDLEYSLNSISKSIVHTSSLIEEKDIHIKNYVNVVSVEKPSSIYMLNIFNNSNTIDTKSAKLDALSTKVFKDVRISLSISDRAKLLGKTKDSLAVADYSFKSNVNANFTIDKKDTNLLHPVPRGSQSYINGLNYSFSTEVPKSLDDDSLRLKLPDDNEGGKVISGTYKTK